jgi:hypothetical protein
MIFPNAWVLFEEPHTFFRGLDRATLRMSGFLVPCSPLEALVVTRLLPTLKYFVAGCANGSLSFVAVVDIKESFSNNLHV